MADGRYILEIYRPDNGDTPLASFSSDSPFMAMHAGDLVNARLLHEDARPEDPPLIVTHVEHYVWDGPDGPHHKLAVYTKQEQPPAGFRIRGF